jgi:hypothetical protein
MKNALFFLFLFMTFISCSTNNVASANIYDELVASNLLYRFHLKSLPFGEIADYLENNRDKVESIYITVSIPTPRDSLTQMIPIDLNRIELSDLQKLKFIRDIRHYMTEKNEAKNAHLKFDLMMQIRMIDGSGVEILMETKSHEEWNRISYSVFKDKQVSRVVRGYRIQKALEFQRNIAQFILSIKGNDGSAGIQRLNEIWQD